MSIEVKIGKLKIGGANRIAIQTMADVSTSFVDKVVREEASVRALGCDVFRVAVKDENDAKAISELKKRMELPLVCDIHFDYKLALLSLDGGADKIRINPGNIGSEKNVGEVAAALLSSGAAVRVGSNSGSISKEYLEKYGRSGVALAESALKNVAILERYGVKNIVISVKSSSVKMNDEANRYLAEKTDYPLHLGVTEAGYGDGALIKSAIGIGSLLIGGIGATIRVSLTDTIEKEVIAAHGILRAVGLEKDYVEVISCPTCGRTRYNSKELCRAVSEKTAAIKKRLKVAVMGCVVNGPGEAADCDIGIAGGDGKCVIFKKGKVFRTVLESEAEAEFLKEIDILLSGDNG